MYAVCVESHGGCTLNGLYSAAAVLVGIYSLNLSVTCKLCGLYVANSESMVSELVLCLKAISA